MPFAYASLLTTMSCCKWTQALGRPVLPDEYNQNAASSLLVDAASRVDELSDSASLKLSMPGHDSVPTTRTVSRNLKFCLGIALISGSRASLTIAARARESLSR